MNKNKLPLRLSLALSLGATWLGIMPLVTFAGSDSVDPAGHPDMSNTVNDGAQVIKIPEPDADVEYDTKRETIYTSPELYSLLNDKASEIANDPNFSGNPVVLHLKGEGGSEAILSSLTSVGIEEGLVEELLASCGGLLSNPNGEGINLDKLDGCITAFNHSVKANRNNPAVLSQLKNNSEFTTLRQILLELRAILKK